jgi:hypothetical protein
MSIFSILFVFFSPFLVEVKGKKKRICNKFGVKKVKKQCKVKVLGFSES